MYHEKFNLTVLIAKEKRLTAEIIWLEKRLEEKRTNLKKVVYQRLDQEFKINRLIQST